MIAEFQGEYRFLSNFYSSPVTYGGITYKSNEAAFQAHKSLDIRFREKLSKVSNPSDAKWLGRNEAVLREDWECVKDKIMFEICHAKFSQDEYLKHRLLDTGDEYLQEGNTWGDHYWGVDKWGENKLGEILMKVRSILKNEQL